MASHDDDLVASKTEGFKVGEKKTVEEYAKLGKFAQYSMVLFYVPLTLYEPGPVSQKRTVKQRLTFQRSGRRGSEPMEGFTRYQ